MQVVVPMSGMGKRFLVAGYQQPKPLIQVEGKPMIEHVVEMFPGESDFLFICNKQHVQTTSLLDVIKRITPQARIVIIDYQGKGPVYALTHAFDQIFDEEPVMVCYCDFSCVWDWGEFKKIIEETNCDGAVPCYTGFHPHLLRGQLYAGVLADEDNFMLDIQEKHCFTEDPMDCYHSAGSYYFKSGAEMKKYFQEALDSDLHTNGEYYVSMVYKLLKRDSKKVYIHPLDQFLQWGTPEDLEEYEAWSRFFSQKLGLDKKSTIIPEIREANVTIKYQPESDEYKKSHDYWLRYFNWKLNQQNIRVDPFIDPC